MFKPSKYQQAIYDEFDTTNHNLVVSAVAGSGKTSTLLQLLKRTYLPTAFLAFNKSIQQEIESKVSQPNVTVSTIHSLGMKSLLRHFRRNIKVQANKPWELAKKLGWQIEPSEYVRTMTTVHQLVDLYRLTLCQDADDLRKVADELGVEYSNDEISKSIDLMREIDEYNKNPEMIDFTDMIYIPATNRQIRLALQPKLVFVDECQDLNACQHQLIDRLINENRARFVAVGDPYQSIYGFAGAHSKSFDLFLEKPNVKQMPLSICYRCGTRIVDKANRVYNIMEPFEKNPPGIVRVGEINEIQEGDMVICRNVRPLVDVYFKLLANGMKATIKGKDIGKGLIKLIKPLPPHTTVGQMNTYLFAKLSDKQKELQDRGIINVTNHPSYGNLSDKIDVLFFIAEQYATVGQVIAFLERLFSDNEKKGVVLSTIHKSKGLEADNVFILDVNLIPSKYATTKDQLKQERNLLYVAITRAKNKLIYINSNKTKR